MFQVMQIGIMLCNLAPTFCCLCSEIMHFKY
jgi:hypothetical protein